MALRKAHRPKLSKMVIHPTNIQRTSAKLAFPVFHDSTVAALIFYSSVDHPEWSEAYKFIT